MGTIQLMRYFIVPKILCVLVGLHFWQMMANDYSSLKTTINPIVNPNCFKTHFVFTGTYISRSH